MKPQAPKPKSEHVSKILEVGKEKGYITYKQVNDILPEEVVSSEEIDDILLMLGENDIKVVDQEDKAAAIPDEEKDSASSPPGAIVKEEEEEEGEEFEKAFATAGAETRMTDPVKMYLHEMGRIPLLTREQEIAIAKRIEAGEFKVEKAVLGSALGFQELHALFTDILKKKKTLNETIDLDPYADLPGGVPEKQIYSKIQKNQLKLNSMEKQIKALQHKAALKSLSSDHRKNLAEQLDAKLIDLIWLVKDCQFQKKVKERLIGRLRDQGEAVEEQEYVHAHPGKTAQAVPRTLPQAGLFRKGGFGQSHGEGSGKEKPPEGRRFREGRGRMERSPPRDQEAREGFPGHPGRAQGHDAQHPRRASGKPIRPAWNWWRPTCAWSSPSPRNTPTAACPSWT